MTLAPGMRLGPYEIDGRLGAGGMGEVYRANDTRLNRAVAIKVLPAQMAANTHLRQRLEREARTISSLNHPRICSLFDVGHQDGIDFLVMEYLEGETLAARLEKGPLPQDRLLRYAIEISDALDKAHREGVTHRDLKPANIMLTKSGAKLMDFGLAKLEKTDLLGGALEAPTAEQVTKEGTILGTLQYMAPEQLEGKEADARSDIFALGAVLYEMATGRLAFMGRSKATLISAILTSEPPLISTLQPMASPALDRVVKTCLAKDPDERWQTVHEVKVLLEWVAEGGSMAGIPAPVSTRRKYRERFAWTVSIGLVAMAITFAVYYFLPRSAEVRAVRSTILPAEKSGFAFAQIDAGPVTVSQDGRRLAFVAPAADGKKLLWVRPLDSLSAQSLHGTEGASYPFWSPQGDFLGFFADGKLKKIAISGGEPVTLSEAEAGRGGTWNRDGVILFAPTARSPLYRISVSGGEASKVTQVEESRRERSHRWPYFLPDGQSFLFRAEGFVSGVEGEATGIYLASLDSKEPTLLLRSDSNAEFASGYLLFMRDRTLMAQMFDAKRRRLEGNAFRIAEHVQNNPDTRRGVFSVSESGVLAYQGGAETGSQLTWFDRNGKKLGQIPEPGVYYSPQLSPDGQRVAVEVLDPRTSTTDIWIYELSRGGKIRFTIDPGFDIFPVWSPDGKRIAFASNRKGSYDIYQKPSDGSGSEQVLLESDAWRFPTGWSPDGHFIAYNQVNQRSKNESELWILPLQGEGKPFAFQSNQQHQLWGTFSPDGGWMAYSSHESGQEEIFVAPFLGKGRKFQISTAGGRNPKWRRDGEELVYLSADDKLMSAQVRGKGPNLEIDIGRTLFQTRPTHLRGTHDISGDGKRFLVVTAAEDSTAPITLVLNWTADLRR